MLDLPGRPRAGESFDPFLQGDAAATLKRAARVAAMALERRGEFPPEPSPQCWERFCLARKKAWEGNPRAARVPHARRFFLFWWRSEMQGVLCRAHLRGLEKGE